MSADRAIDEVLSEAGFSEAPERARARAALESAGLTRAGKSRISEEKVARVRELLRERFFVHCQTPACQAAAVASGREAVPSANRSACESCGGSDNRRVEADLVAACARAGIRRIVIVGGSPATREELAAHLGTQLELRMVDGTERRTQEKAKGDLAWADLVLVWGASELNHKVSTLYTSAPPPLKRKVVHVPKRGIAALLGAAVMHVNAGRG